MRLAVSAAAVTLLTLAADARGAAPAPFVRDDAAVKRALSDELTRTMKELKVDESPGPYFAAYALSDLEQSSATATFGAATGAASYRGRTLRAEVRVGDAHFDNSNTAESMFGGNVESLPVDDDYATLRRELWLRTDEAYKAAVETLAKKRSAAAGQAASSEEDANLPDFAAAKPAQLVLAAKEVAPEAAALVPVATQLSALMRAIPEVSGGRVTATYSTIRRRFISSEGGFSDETKGTMRVDAVAETQAADGMRLVDFVTFTALDLASLPPVAEMEKGVRRMLDELVAMRTAPIAPSGVATVLFEGAAAGQIVKLLLGDNLSGTPAPRTAGGSEERNQSSELADRLGQKIASPLLMATDDPLRETGPGNVALYGAYHVDDEGIAAAKVPLVEGGILKSLLMTRTPRKEIPTSNGHARATRFGGPRALVGSLFVSGKPGVPKAALSRAQLLGEAARLARAGGVTTYVVKRLDDPSIPGVANPSEGISMISLGGSGRSAPSVRPLVVFRVGADGKEQAVRGLTLEGLVPRSLRDITAIGRDATVYNYQEGGVGFVGIPSSIVTPPLLFADIDVRRSVGKHKRPPLYPRPSLAK